LGDAGQGAEELAVTEEALARTERTEKRWRIAEFLRIKDELLLLQGAPGAAAAAEDHFRQVLDWARRQGTLSFELRAATSLTQLMRDQGRPADTLALPSRSTTVSPKGSTRPTSMSATSLPVLSICQSPTVE
jgi:predicted ATPase